MSALSHLGARNPGDATGTNASQGACATGRLDANDNIPADAQEEISRELRSHVSELDADSAYSGDLANEIAEVSVRGALQDRGYFRATATTKLTILQTEGADVSVVAAVRATPGPQYRTGNVRFESTDSSYPLILPPEGLRHLIALQKGELFSIQGLRTASQNLVLAYGRVGCIDMTAEPEFKIDEDRRTIDLVFRINREMQYRVGGIEFLGVNDVTREKLMASLSKPGEVFDSTKLDEFFKVNRTTLPPDASVDDVTVERDTKLRTVRILFDFRACPQHSN